MNRIFNQFKSNFKSYDSNLTFVVMIQILNRFESNFRVLWFEFLTNSNLTFVVMVRILNQFESNFRLLWFKFLTNSNLILCVEFSNQLDSNFCYDSNSPPIRIITFITVVIRILNPNLTSIVGCRRSWGSGLGLLLIGHVFLWCNQHLGKGGHREWLWNWLWYRSYWIQWSSISLVSSRGLSTTGSRFHRQ